MPDIKISDDTQRAPTIAAMFPYEEGGANYWADASQILVAGAANLSAALLFNKGLHVQTASSSGATASTDADELYLEGSGNIGITLGGPNTSTQALNFADPQGSAAGQVAYNHTTNTLSLTSDGVARLSMSNAVLVINDTGANFDVRIEGDAETDLLYLKASTDQVFIAGTQDVSGSRLTVLQAPIDLAPGAGGLVDATTSPGLGLIAETSATGYGVGIWFGQDSGSIKAGIASARRNTSNWGTDLRFYTHVDAIQDLNDVYEQMVLLANGGLFLRDSSVGPGTPTGGIHLWADSGELKVTDTGGNTTTLS